MYGNTVIGDGESVLSCIQELVPDRDKLARRGPAGVEVLASDRLFDGTIAAVGYCFGGRAVLELARSGAELAGAISAHGALETASPASPGAVKAKVLVCHGALDHHVPTAQVAGFIEEMDAAGTDFQLIVYDGAMHGFTHEVGPQGPGVASDPVSDKRSFLAIKAFLPKSLSASSCRREPSPWPRCKHRDAANGPPRRRVSERRTGGRRDGRISAKSWMACGP
jgi:dienelactone hydrolase